MNLRPPEPQFLHLWARPLCRVGRQSHRLGTRTSGPLCCFRLTESSSSRPAYIPTYLIHTTGRGPSHQGPRSPLNHANLVEQPPLPGDRGSFPAASPRGCLLSLRGCVCRIRAFAGGSETQPWVSRWPGPETDPRPSRDGLLWGHQAWPCAPSEVPAEKPLTSPGRGC